MKKGEGVIQPPPPNCKHLHEDLTTEKQKSKSHPFAFYQ